MEPTTIKLDYPEWMSEAEKQALDDKLNALFEHRQFASEAEMNQAIQEAVETHLGMELHFEPSPAQLWLERIPLILSAVILVVGLYWRYGLGQ
ncbi:MAG: hypothetical protein AAGE59_36065 [Cyanobacteria bacterium P01_F01_bin.86]